MHHVEGSMRIDMGGDSNRVDLNEKDLYKI